MKSASDKGRASPKLSIVVPHPGKIFWHADGYTRLDLAEYYATTFPKLSV